MADEDFEAIMKKYRSLVGRASERKLELSEKGPSLSQELEAGSQELGAGSLPQEWVDEVIDSERFIRAPLASHTLQLPEELSYQSLPYHSLFAAPGSSELTLESPLLSQSEQQERDLKAAEFVRQLYPQPLDLRHSYDPALGIYPGQAVYVPRRPRDQPS